MMRTEYLGLYVHIPFCLKKCNYCDFCSFSDLENETKIKYIETLKKEIGSYIRKEKIKVDTIFFGGGTPSLLSASEFICIVKEINRAFDISSLNEFTVEVNPKTISPETLSAYKECGVNRISMGMQSIHENELKYLGRIHSYADFAESYSMTKNAGFDNISVDIMYGIPEQTKESFKQTLGKIIELSPEHISVYSLIVEENTPFWQKKEILPLPTEENECEMYYTASELLNDAGYRHYEISNYSKENFESKHNLKYWRAEEYIGIGVSAYSYFEGRRFGNTRSFDEYLSGDGFSADVEVLSENDLEFEYAMLNLRLSFGFKLSEYKMLFGKDFVSSRNEVIKKYADTDCLKIENDRIFLTQKGFYISNNILSELL